MRLSWKIGRVAGIDLYIHATFLLVFLFIPDMFGGGVAAVWSTLLVLALFGCVLLHELGHALMARQFGIVTEDITLYPIGGVARLRRLPRAPGAELLIALAGPAVNFAICAALAPLAWFGLVELDAFRLGFIGWLFYVNLGLGIFNLVPAFPMDGGRVLRALLSGFVGRARATTYAARVGRVLAVCFGCVALFVTHQPVHVALAVFIYLAGRIEEVQVLNEELHRKFASPSQGLWLAPPGYRWVERSDGTWQLAPAGVRFPDPEPSGSPWR
jgi:Zn-dependent protease